MAEDGEKVALYQMGQEPDMGSAVSGSEAPWGGRSLSAQDNHFRGLEHGNDC